MVEGQVRAAALLREQAERIERLFDAALGEAKEPLGGNLPVLVEEVRSIIAALDVVRERLVLQERTLADALDRTAKQSGSA